MYYLILNPPFLFAIALVFSGEAASVTATFSSQVVSEGFILWKFPRLLGLMPSMIVAMMSERTGLNTFLVASQVAPSVICVVPARILHFLRNGHVRQSCESVEMNVSSDEMAKTELNHALPSGATPSGCSKIMLEDVKTTTTATSSDVQPHGDMIDFSNKCIVAAVAYAIWFLITVANVYEIVALNLPG